MVLDFLAVDNFDFTRKIVKKNLGEKLVKMLGFFVKIEFLDRNLTFRIACRLLIRIYRLFLKFQEMFYCKLNALNLNYAN